MTHLTRSDVLDLMAQAVADKPEGYVYQNTTSFEGDPACLYSHGDKPGCLVGDVLHRAGVPLSSLDGWKGSWGSPLRYRLVREHGIALDEDAYFTLRKVQLRQDVREPWSVILDRAQRGDI